GIDVEANIAVGSTTDEGERREEGATGAGLSAVLHDEFTQGRRGRAGIAAWGQGFDRVHPPALARSSPDTTYPLSAARLKKLRPVYLLFAACGAASRAAPQ